MPIFSSVFFTRVLSGFEDVFGSESADLLGTSGSWFSSSASSWGAGAGGTLTLFAVLELEIRKRTCSIALLTRGSFWSIDGCTTRSTYGKSLECLRGQV